MTDPTTPSSVGGWRPETPHDRAPSVACSTQCGIDTPLGVSTNRLDDEKRVWAEALAGMADLWVQEVVIDGGVEVARLVVAGTMAHGVASVDPTGRFSDRPGVMTPLRDGTVEAGGRRRCTLRVRVTSG